MVCDFFDIIIECIDSLSAGELSGAVLIALLMGALCWVACSYYTRLWHKRFHVKFKHHLLCALAALLTVIFTIQFRAVGNLDMIVDGIIDDWYENLLEDNNFNSKTYETAFYLLKGKYRNQFDGVPEPDESGSYIPFGNDDLIQLCTESYVESACYNFSTQHPFLNAMLSAQPGLSENDIILDIEEFFRKNSRQIYPLNRAITIAANYIRESLLEQSPKTVWKTRFILVLLFLVVQLVPFGVIGYCAYKGLRIKKNAIYN